MLRTKSILAPHSDYDGLRVSVMSRHTLNDGKTPHPDINSSSFIVHFKSLAPPPKLVGAYYKNLISWHSFEKLYISYLRTPEVEPTVKILAKHSLDHDVTILCIEDDPLYCHRRLLANECRTYYPSLKLFKR